MQQILGFDFICDTPSLKKSFAYFERIRQINLENLQEYKVDSLDFS